MPVQGTDLPIWGMEIDAEEAADEFRTFAGSSSSTGKVRVTC